MRTRTAVFAATTALIAAGALVLTGAAPATAETMRIGVSTVQYDSPGAVVPAIVTVYNVPRGYTATITATGTGGSTVACYGSAWRNPVRSTVSRTCYLRLPNLYGSYLVKGTARVTNGYTTRTVSGSASRAVTADGKASPIPMSLDTIRGIERCHNTTDEVWLTFDDGGSYAQVTSILATLSRNNVKGRFFFRGDWARANPALMQKIKTAGHLIGNHTSTHRMLHRDSRTTVLSQIAGGTGATGTPKLLRPPFGSGAFTTRLQQIAAEQNYLLCRWTTDTYDWDGTTVSRMVERITYGDYRSAPIRAGGNILMHGHGTYTASGLQEIIDAVRAKGLRLPRLR